MHQTPLTDVAPASSHPGIARNLANFTATLSLISCGLVILVYIAFRSMRKFFFRLVLYISVCDFWFSLAILLGNPVSKSPRCVAQAVLITYFGLATILWSLVLTIVLRQTIFLKSFGVEEAEFKYHLMCWGIPLVAILLSLVLADMDSLGGYWCWLGGSTQISQLMRWCVFYFPLWGVTIYGGVTYLEIVRFMKSVIRRSYFTDKYEESQASGSPCITDEEVRDYHRKTAKACQSIKRLLYIPLSLSLCWAFGSVARLLNLMDHTAEIPVLEGLALIAGGCHGFINTVLYSWISSVRVTLLDDTIYVLRQWKSGQTDEWVRRNRSASTPASQSFRSPE